MPIYFFNLYGSPVVRDAAGQELPDDNAAREEALAVAAELGRNAPSATKEVLIVENDKGEVICEIPVVAT